MKGKIKKSVSALIVFAMLLSVMISVMSVVKAVDISTETGSLTIVKYEVNSERESEYDDTNGILLNGVTFAIYKIDDDSESTEIPSGATAYATQETGSGTNDKGTVVFSDLPLGRYLVVEVSAPENVVSKIANFIVDIPMTEDDGTTLNYDVTVYPKNNTVYGGVVLNKYGMNWEKYYEDLEFMKNENENPSTEEMYEIMKKYGVISELQGVSFELQKYDDSTSAWSKYDYEGTLVTDSQGQITVTGLPAGDYRFIEISTVNDYILDNYTSYEFSVSLDNSGNTVVSPSTIYAANYKPTISKEVVNPTEDYSYNVGDTVTYEITIYSTTCEFNKETSTFDITDVLPEGVTYVEDSMDLSYLNYSDLEWYDVDYTSWQYKPGYDSSTGKIAFFEEVADEPDVPMDASLEESNTYSWVGFIGWYDGVAIKITYDAVIGSDADATAIGNTNTASLTYSTVVNKDYAGNANEETTATISDSATVYTGGFWIEKRAKSTSGDLLEGATFKIATSEQNAKDGIFIQDENDEDITITTDENGKASYKGLAYGDYYLVETQAPQDASGNYYNLLTSPQMITVSANTYSAETATATVVNKMGFELPATGGIGIGILVIFGVALISTGVIMIKRNK